MVTVMMKDDSKDIINHINDWGKKSESKRAIVNFESICTWEKY